MPNFLADKVNQLLDVIAGRKDEGPGLPPGFDQSYWAKRAADPNQLTPMQPLEPGQTEADRFLKMSRGVAAPADPGSGDPTWAEITPGDAAWGFPGQMFANNIDSRGYFVPSEGPMQNQSIAMDDVDADPSELWSMLQELQGGGAGGGEGSDAGASMVDHALDPRRLRGGGRVVGLE